MKTIIERRKYYRDYYSKNKDQMKISKLKYQAANPGKIPEYMKKYQVENKERIKKNHYDYAEKNKEKIKSYSNKYYLKNKEKIAVKQKEYRKNNPDKMKEYSKMYLIKNKDKIVAKRKIYNAEVRMPKVKEAYWQKRMLKPKNIIGQHMVFGSSKSTALQERREQNLFNLENDFPEIFKKTMKNEDLVKLILDKKENEA